uniref:N-acetylglucosaminylphosphatidylinositol deacetylase n=1 Tax=Trichuris muris TaxID=70415 RepID=A0A5S6QW62_TRIMR
MWLFINWLASLLCWFIYAYPLFLWLRCVKRRRAQLSKCLGNLEGKVALLAIAHPDDECMFFSPCILNLRRLSCRIVVACLTPGGYRHNGEIRKTELLKSCNLLGIPENDVLIVEDQRLPDNPSISWDYDIVASLLEAVIVNRKIDFVFTFDQFGVSGHLNHCVIHRCCRHLLQQHRMPAASEKLCFVNSPFDLLQSFRSMAMHRSQLQWFRVLYLIYSRYMLVNHFTVLE